MNFFLLSEAFYYFFLYSYCFLILQVKLFANEKSTLKSQLFVHSSVKIKKALLNNVSVGVGWVKTGTPVPIPTDPFSQATPHLPQSLFPLTSTQVSQPPATKYIYTLPSQIQPCPAKVSHDLPSPIQPQQPSLNHYCSTD